MTRLLLVLALAAASCAAQAPRKTAAPLAASDVPWNAARADVGKISAVAELGDAVVMVGDAATILVGGSVAAVDRSAHGWTWAGTIAAPDGSGTWLVAATADGQLRRLRARSALEPISDRFGLASERVRAACSSGPHDTVFLLDSGLARSDGGHIHRVDGAFTSIACAPGVVAAASASEVRLLGPAGGDRVLTLPSPLIALTAKGRLLAASGAHLFASSPGGELVRVHEARAPITGLASAGEGAWFSSRGALGYFDGSGATEADDARLGDATRLASSPSGDVWTLSAGGVSRITRGAVPTPDGAWRANVAPLFQRTCSRCHGPGGSSGLDLSTAAAWTASRAEIQRRVLEKRDMPPAGVVFPEADRETVRRFVGGR